ncbi:MAG TPA: FAD-dependent oxidoreductase [Desulfosporosinus sp.]
MKEKYSNLFEPIKIGKLEIKNRFSMAPMGPGGLCSEDGSFNEKGVEYYVERAKGGTGLIITGVTLVENDIEKCVMPSMPCPTLNPVNFIKVAKSMTERVHAYDAKIFLQLSAGFGRVSIPGIIGMVDPIGPSAIPHRWVDGLITRALTIDEIKTFVRKFAESAAIAKKAGFDGVEIHAVHEGYLLDQFTIALFNHRTDEYGGSLMNRLRFPIEIVQAIKAKCGEDFPVSLRYSVKSFIKGLKQGGLPGEEFVEVGRDIEEGLEVAKILEQAGYDAFNSDVGSYDAWYWSHPPMYHEKGLYLPFNEQLKKVLKVPVITAGRMEDPELASAAITDGKTDMIGLGRPLLADPEIPNKIKADKIDKIRPCLSCQDGCMGRLATYATISCAVNPAAGREREYGIEPAKTIKNVVVVGGGIAGCETARVAAIRGHNVTLFEKTDKLGGNLIPGGVPRFKEDDRRLVEWYTDELKELNVKVKHNTLATKELIMAADVDVVVIATGSTPKIFKLPNSDNSKVLVAADVLLGKNDAGSTTVIVGGGLVGCELALWLAQQGKKVTIVEALKDILAAGPALCHANSDMLKDLLKFNKVDIRKNSSIVALQDGEAVIKTEKGEDVIRTDSVILAVGYNSERSLYNEIKNDINDIHLLGDARQVQNIMYAIWDAYEVARNI